ncbi:hypothetical protein [Rothia sp. ND6WE1A]|uniref:hypothetical protein n=1 Tax=Rothia sp. ND6WE1A TaxID=1848190 RepID=UPI0008345D4E|nr:hypothetical protein [Rothia sp. ND6WE1A]
MVGISLKPQEMFRFDEIIKDSPEGILNVSLSEESPDLPLIYKLKNAGFVSAKTKANGNLTSAVLTSHGKELKFNVRDWVETSGRRGKLQLNILQLVKDGRGDNVSELVQDSDNSYTEDEICEAIEDLERAGAIKTYSAWGRNFPVRIDLQPGWETKMNREEVPAWTASENSTYVYNSTDNSRNTHTTNTFHGDIAGSQIAIGDNATQTLTSNNGLPPEALTEITAYFENLNTAIREEVSDFQQQQELLELATRAEQEMKQASSKDEAQSTINKLMNKFVELGITEASTQLMKLLFAGARLAFGLPF